MSTQPLPDPHWKALSALLPGRIEPLSPERIYDGPKTSVYRLPGAGRGGSPVGPWRGAGWAIKSSHQLGY
jgi:hypothetical protein